MRLVKTDRAYMLIDNNNDLIFLGSLEKVKAMALAVGIEEPCWNEALKYLEQCNHSVAYFGVYGRFMFTTAA